MTQHSAGAIRAAFRIDEIHKIEHTPFVEIVADIIDEETHAAKVIAFVEHIAAWDYDIQGDCVAEAQQEAFELLKKWRG